MMQIKLDPDQIKAFYHDEFVTSQVHAFTTLVTDRGLKSDVVVDIGGGVGHFAGALSTTGNVGSVRVIDMDPVSVQLCKGKGVDAKLGDALVPPVDGDEDVVCFNLILHHLVGASELTTLAMQTQALTSWQGKARVVFVNEYVYDSYWSGASGKLIYTITKSRFLSQVCKVVSRVIPSLSANTFGIGVRFRAHDEWISIFQKIGYRVQESLRGAEENVSPARRMLLIKSCRRDSFLLVPQ